MKEKLKHAVHKRIQNRRFTPRRRHTAVIVAVVGFVLTVSLLLPDFAVAQAVSAAQPDIISADADRASDSGAVQRDGEPPVSSPADSAATVSEGNSTGTVSDTGIGTETEIETGVETDPETEIDTETIVPENGVIADAARDQSNGGDTGSSASSSETSPAAQAGMSGRDPGQRAGQNDDSTEIEVITEESGLLQRRVAADGTIRLMAAQEDPYQISLYGYNFGGIYGQYSTTSTAAVYKRLMIGWPDLLSNYADIMEKLTFERISALSDLPFTFSSEGFDLESSGFVQTEQNTFAGVYYDMVGFVPVLGSDIEAMRNTDAYKASYAFDDPEEAQSFVTSQAGVLYGEKPSEEMLQALQEKGSLAIVWRARDPRAVNSIVLRLRTPSKVKQGEERVVTLQATLNKLQAGDYTEHPLPVTLSLSDGLTFSAGSDLTVSSADVECPASF